MLQMKPVSMSQAPLLFKRDYYMYMWYVVIETWDCVW